MKKTLVFLFFYSSICIYNFQFIYALNTLPEGINNKGKQTIASGDVYILSVGISEYITANKNYVFNNTIHDARSFPKIIERDFSKMDTGNFRVYSTVLINKEASRKRILAEINNIINKSKPGDYFFFNFAGHTYEDTNVKGHKEIYFTPYLTKSIDRAQDLIKDTLMISLKDLRDLFEFIEAKQQFILSEAGNTPNFRTSLIESLMENSKHIASISTRNRVIVVPDLYGMDNLRCGDTVIEHGPILYFLDQIKQTELSVFDFFSSSLFERKRVQYYMQRVEMGCQWFQLPYTTFFYEKDFLKDYAALMSNKTSLSRGADAEEVIDATIKTDKIGRKFSLIVGTDMYDTGFPEWKNLDNPQLDASVIHQILMDDYGYRSKLLPANATADVFLQNLKSITDSLRENDQFIIYLAGHGLYDPKFFNDGFLVFSNSMPKPSDPMRRTYVPFSMVRNIIENMKNNQILFLVDVCYGGKFDIHMSSQKTRAGNSLYDDRDAMDYINEKLSLKTKIILTSGSLNEVPDGYKGEHSPFAKRLIDVLHGGGGDKGYLTSMDLFQSLSALKSKPVRGEFSSNDLGAEFILVKTRKK